MRETVHEGRFKRDMILNRVKLHLTQRQDLALPMPVHHALNQAYYLVSEVHRKALEKDAEQLNQGKEQPCLHGS